MSRIEELMKKDFWNTEILEHPAQAFEQGYKMGANAVLDEIENILSLEYNTMATVDLIVEKVKELKGE